MARAICSPCDANPENLMECVARVYERYMGEGKSSGSDKWTMDSRVYRPQMLHDVYLEWVTLVGNDGIFPWHEDYVCHLWVNVWRKADRLKKAEYCEELGITCISNMTKDERNERRRFDEDDGEGEAA